MSYRRSRSSLAVTVTGLFEKLVCPQTLPEMRIDNRSNRKVVWPANRSMRFRNVWTLFGDLFELFMDQHRAVVAYAVGISWIVGAKAFTAGVRRQLPR